MRDVYCSKRACDNRYTRLFSVIDDVLRQNQLQLPNYSSADVR